MHLYKKSLKCFGKYPSGTSDRTKESSAGTANRDGGTEKLIPNQTSPILDADHCMYSGHPQQPSSIWHSKTFCEPLPKCTQGEEKTEARMEIEGDMGGAIPGVL